MPVLVKVRRTRQGHTGTYAGQHTHTQKKGTAYSEGLYRHTGYIYKAKGICSSTPGLTGKVAQIDSVKLVRISLLLNQIGQIQPMQKLPFRAPHCTLKGHYNLLVFPQGV